LADLTPGKDSNIAATNGLQGPGRGEKLNDETALPDYEGLEKSGHENPDLERRVLEAKEIKDCKEDVVVNGAKEPIDALASSDRGQGNGSDSKNDEPGSPLKKWEPEISGVGYSYLLPPKLEDAEYPKSETETKNGGLSKWQSNFENERSEERAQHDGISLEDSWDEKVGGKSFSDGHQAKSEDTSSDDSVDPVENFLIRKGFLGLKDTEELRLCLLKKIDLESGWGRIAARNRARLRDIEKYQKVFAKVLEEHKTNFMPNDPVVLECQKDMGEIDWSKPVMSDYERLVLERWAKRDESLEDGTLETKPSEDAVLEDGTMEAKPSEVARLETKPSEVESLEDAVLEAKSSEVESLEEASLAAKPSKVASLEDGTLEAKPSAIGYFELPNFKPQALSFGSLDAERPSFWSEGGKFPEAWMLKAEGFGEGGSDLTGRAGDHADMAKAREYKFEAIKLEAVKGEGGSDLSGRAGDHADMAKAREYKFEALKLEAAKGEGVEDYGNGGDFADLEPRDFDPNERDLSEIESDRAEGGMEMEERQKTVADIGEETGEVQKEGGTASEKELYQPHGAELVIESRDWYLGQNSRLFKVLMFVFPIILLSLALNVWQVVFKPEPRYFAVTQDLRIMEMPPLSEPVIENRSLGNWAGDVVVRALSLNFLTWRQTLSDLRGEFDPTGFESFLDSLKNGGHLDKIEKERLSLSSLISGAPVITGSGLRGGVMTWKLEMPLVLSYESSAGVVASQKLLAEVVVQRTKPSLNPKGVVIRQIVLTKTG
jgi:intracellular multiplication protein IcmL